MNHHFWKGKGNSVDVFNPFRLARYIRGLTHEIRLCWATSFRYSTFNGQKNNEITGVKITGVRLNLNITLL